MGVRNTGCVRWSLLPWILQQVGSKVTIGTVITVEIKKFHTQLLIWRVARFWYGVDTLAICDGNKHQNQPNQNTRNRMNIVSSWKALVTPFSKFTMISWLSLLYIYILRTSLNTYDFYFCKSTKNTFKWHLLTQLYQPWSNITEKSTCSSFLQTLLYRPTHSSDIRIWFRVQSLLSFLTKLIFDIRMHQDLVKTGIKYKTYSGMIKG